MHDETGKAAKFVDSWEDQFKKKKIADSIVVEAKENSMSGHWGRENGNAFLANAGGLTCIFQKMYNVKNVKSAGETGSKDQETDGEF